MNKILLQKAIYKWGHDIQVNKLQEELLELALVINQLKCPTKNPDKLEGNLYSELADVKIMMAQAELLFDSERINQMVDYKMKRMEEKYFKT